jgi:SAM-dependent methyltransferase
MGVMTVFPGAALSPRLRTFVSEAPLEREQIVQFLAEAAAAIQPGARVLDAGAGQAPYRELFDHCSYVTSDWAQSQHPEAARSDVIAPLDSLPVESGSFDAIVSTQVLEHVGDPAAVLAELHRVLTPGGRLWLTAPFVGELHEEPFDFYRYTSHGLRHLLVNAGFEEVSVEPIGGYFSAMAALSRNCGLAIGADTRGDGWRRLAALVGRGLARLLPALDGLDRRRALPIGYRCRGARAASTSR